MLGLSVSTAMNASWEALRTVEAGCDLRPLYMSGLHGPLAMGTSSGALGPELPATFKPRGTSELAGLQVALGIWRFLKRLRALTAWLGSLSPGISVLLGLPTSLAFCASSDDEVGQRLRAAPYLHARSACMPMSWSITIRLRCPRVTGCSCSCHEIVEWQLTACMRVLDSKG